MKLPKRRCFWRRMTPVSSPVSNCSLMAAEPRSNRKGGDFFGEIAPKARATTMTSKGDGMNVEFLRRLYLQEGETNMNSLKDNVAVVTDAMYVIVGASGNTGSIIANSLLSKGKKVRVMGARCGATGALCTQRRGSGHGQT